MEEREAFGDRPEPADSALQALLKHVFRCRHRRKTFPFTPRGEDQCYAVCLDCGQRLGSDLLNPGTPRKHDKASPKEPPEPKGPVPSRLANAVPRSLMPDLDLRNWKYDLLWVGLFVVGLSGGLSLTSRIRQSAAAQRPVLPAACGEVPAVSPKRSPVAASVSTASVNTRDAEVAPDPVPQSVAASPNDRTALPATQDDPGSNQVIARLVSRSSVAVLSLEASAVVELSENPRRLGDLIQNGSLFTVPSGTPIQVRETENGVLKVEVLEGSMAGREGWVRASQVTPRYRPKQPSRRRELRQLREQ
jgi:hypothetical protein